MQNVMIWIKDITNKRYHKFAADLKKIYSLSNVYLLKKR